MACVSVGEGWFYFSIWKGTRAYGVDEEMERGYYSQLYTCGLELRFHFSDK